jgi:hypothetical protein
MKNWRTTTLGVLGLISLLIGATTAVLDGDPATNVDLAVLLPLLFAGISSLVSKDAKVTGGSIPATDEAAARLG